MDVDDYNDDVRNDSFTDYDDDASPSLLRSIFSIFSKRMMLFFYAWFGVVALPCGNHHSTE